MSASDARSANWRNLAADIGDLKETDRWVRANARDEVEADAAMKWYAEHATELPQLTTDMHPHDQMRVIECGGSVDGITAEYDPGGTTNPEFVEETDED